jgi:hypothetical protein
MFVVVRTEPPDLPAAHHRTGALLLDRISTGEVAPVAE